MTLAHLACTPGPRRRRSARDLRRHARLGDARPMGGAQRRPGRAFARGGPCARAIACWSSCATTLATSRSCGASGGLALVVVPVNAKLHPAEAEWIIDDAQARWALRDRGCRTAGRCAAWSDRSTPSRPRPRRCSRRAAEPRRCGPVERAGRRPGLAVLHQRHHRPAQGRDADAPQPDDDGPDLLRRRRSGRRRRRDGLCRADVARLRPLRDPAPDGRRAPRRAGLGRRRSGRAVRARPRAGPAVAPSPRRPSSSAWSTMPRPPG